MKKARIKVSRFDENDVIATSGYCTKDSTHYYVTGVDTREHVGFVNIYQYNDTSGSLILQTSEFLFDTDCNTYFSSNNGSYEINKWYTNNGMCEIQKHKISQ